MAVARSLGLAVPDDVSVVGFDNVPESALAKPPLTTDRPADPADGHRRSPAPDRPDREPPAATVSGGASHAARRPSVMPGDRGRSVTTAEHATPLYRDADRPVDERVADLLGRMTVEEKVAQLGSAWVFQLADGTSFSTERAPALARATASGMSPASAGRAASTPRDAAAPRQRDPAPPGRGDAARHPGDRARGDLLGSDGARARPFPPGDRRREHAGRRARARARRCRPRADARDRRAPGPLAGARHLPRPPLGPHRGDVRRGPATSSRAWASRSCAGCRATTSRDGVVATAKHFVGYGASEGGMNWAPAHIGARELRDVYLHPFEAAVRDAGLRSVMNAYNEIDGVPVRREPQSAHRAAARRVGLRRHASSPTTSRCASSTSYHRLAADAARRRGDGARRRDRRRAARHRLLRRAAARGTRAPDWSAMDALDDAVRRVLETKFELGLFEQPFVDVASGVAARRHAGPSCPGADDRAQEPRAAEERRHPAARPGPRSIAVIGPNADQRAQPLRRLQLPGTRRVAARDARSRRERLLDRDGRSGWSFGVDRARRADDRRRAARCASETGRLRSRLRREHRVAETASMPPSRWPRRPTSRSW